MTESSGFEYREESTSHRRYRVGELLRHALSNIFVRGELRDPRVEALSVSVSEIRMSPDLRVATIFVSTLGDCNEESLLEGLKRATPFLKMRLGSMGRLRYVPKLTFRIDPAVAQSKRITEVLHGTKVVSDVCSHVAREDGSINEE